MFVGRPPGNYDRLLDFSRPVTGNLFFVPAASLLGSLAAAPAAAPGTPAGVDVAPTPSPTHGDSLAIGSLKGNPQ
jgi:putative iron-dependent peroxidase